MEREKDDKEIEAMESVAQGMVRRIVEKGKKAAKEDFGKFSATLAVIFSIGVWLIKSAWYAHMAGKFSVYNIDKCYINADSENVFLQIIQFTAILVLWFFINYAYYKISITKDESKFSWKKKVKILCFWVTEAVMLFIWCLLSANIKISDFFREITVRSMIVLLILLLFTCVMINIFAIEYLSEERRKKRKYRKVNNQESSLKIKRGKETGVVLLTVILMIAVELMTIFGVSRYMEYNRRAYKLILVQNEANEENEYLFEYDEAEYKCEIYPIVYENEDCYIVTCLYRDSGKIKIDYEFQKIIEKEGQETNYVQDIYSMFR